MLRIRTDLSLEGPEEFIDTVMNLRTAFPDLYYEELEVLSQGNKVVFLANVTGTHTGKFFFCSPNGEWVLI